MADDEKPESGDPRRGLLQAAWEDFIERTRMLTDTMGSVGSGAVGAVPAAVPATVQKWLSSLDQMVDQTPSLTDQLAVMLQELRAKRKSLQALQAELEAFDGQLEIMERSLQPLEAWAKQAIRMRQSMTETLRPGRPRSSD